jgi:hypothetical protein
MGEAVDEKARFMWSGDPELHVTVRVCCDVTDVQAVQALELDLSLRYVLELILIVWAPLQVIRFNQRINPLLYLIHIGLEMTRHRINGCNLQLLE